MRGIWDGIAIERHNLEGVSGQSETANFSGASIKNMKKDAFARVYADGLAVAEHAAVDGEGCIANFIAVGHAFGEGGLHGELTGGFEFLVWYRGSKEILRHVATLTESWLEFFQHKKYFAVVVARVVLRHDVHGTYLATILACGEICTSAIVGVIKTKTRGIGRKHQAALAMCGNEWCAFFGRSVHFR